MMMSEIRSLWQEETITRIYSYLLVVKIKGTFTLDCSRKEVGLQQNTFKISITGIREPTRKAKTAALQVNEQMNYLP